MVSPASWFWLGLAGSASGCDCRPEVVHPIPHVRPSPTAPTPTPEDDIEAARLALVPLHETKRPPLPDDWLVDHPERGQTYAAYRRSHPVTPDRPGEGPRRVLYVQSIGQLGRTHASVVVAVTEYLSRFFGLEVRRPPPLPLSLIVAEARREHDGRRQLLSAFVLDELLAPRLPDDAAAYIALTVEDLWPGRGWNFVFGEASLEGRVGVWSMHRYGDPLAGRESRKRILRRTLRVAAHETAHMFSLRHCTAYECVMNGANSLDESDRGPLWLCPECLAKVLWATGQDPSSRFERLAAFAEAHGLTREAAFFQRSAAAVRAGP